MLPKFDNLIWNDQNDPAKHDHPRLQYKGVVSQKEMGGAGEENERGAIYAFLTFEEGSLSSSSSPLSHSAYSPMDSEESPTAAASPVGSPDHALDDVHAPPSDDDHDLDLGHGDDRVHDEEVAAGDGGLTEDLKRKIIKQASPIHGFFFFSFFILFIYLYIFLKIINLNSGRRVLFYCVLNILMKKKSLCELLLDLAFSVINGRDFVIVFT